MVVAANIPASNGVVHVINGVIAPPSYAALLPAPEDPVDGTDAPAPSPDDSAASSIMSVASCTAAIFASAVVML